MKIDKRIILYLDNQMSDLERKDFEIELSKSDELLKQMESYRSALKGLKVDKQNPTEEDYFVNLVPKFRQNLSTRKKPFKIKTAFAFSVAASILIIFMLVFKPFTSSENNSLDKIISTLDENEAAQIFDYYSDNISAISADQLNGSSDSLFTDLIFSELNFEESDLNKLVSSDGVNIESIYSELKTDEADLIYSKILETKYF